MKDIFIVTDNIHIYREFNKIIDKNKNIKSYFFCSPKSASLFKKQIVNEEIKTLVIKDNVEYLKNNFSLGVSCHSKQIFPSSLVNFLLCVNIHPGYNPYNRGWFPQAFSIMNGFPIGATIHVMDEKIDHGDIICQEEVVIEAHDTSLDVYKKVQNKEIELLEKNIDSILTKSFETKKPFSEGNYNSVKDFNLLKEIDVTKQVSMLEAINYLRAMTHPPYNNAYFLDDSGNKIYVSVNIEKEGKR